MKTLVGIFLALSLAAGLALAEAHKTVIHVINVKWKADATKEQIKAAIDAVHQLPSNHTGIKPAWTNNFPSQGQASMTQAIVMEFESEAAITNYADSPA